MTADDLLRFRASSHWREHRIEVFHHTSKGSVLVKGQRPARSPWRYHVLNGIARMAGLPMLRAAPVLGGAASQRVEVARLGGLAAAGVKVPEVLHVEEDYFVQRFLNGPPLFELLRAGGAQAMLWWQRGVHTLVELHASQQYLSQAFTRNMIAASEQLAMIDFEDDPLQAMPLSQAQARDWLAYLYTSAMTPPGPAEAMAAVLRSALVAEAPAVQRDLRKAATRLRRLLPRLRHHKTHGWRRYLAMLQSTVSLLIAAQAPASHTVHPSESHHARHH